MAALSNGSNESSLCSWYPHKPILDDQTDDDQDRITTSSTIVIDMTNKTKDADKTLESINWDPSLKYAETLWWSSGIKKEKKEACRRRFVKGIEVRGMLYTQRSHQSTVLLYCVVHMYMYRSWSRPRLMRRARCVCDREVRHMRCDRRVYRTGRG